MDRYVSVNFLNFKAYKRFRLDLKHFNILAGPNNAGKSTILASFRILSSGIRKASSRKAIPVMGPDGPTFGYDVDLESISIAEENIFHNYDDSSAASVQFNLTGGKMLTLYFAEQGKCVLIANIAGRAVLNPSQFKSKFNCAIGFVPILGPVEHQESLYEKDAARSALYSYRAARNFRNIWYHYPEEFPSFKELLKQTWPGMDIQAPEAVIREGKTRLYMFCPRSVFQENYFGLASAFKCGVRC